jgi:hypothetical protein
MSSSSEPMPDPAAPDPAADLLDRVLEPLLDDFARGFDRGLELLAHCPGSVLPPERQRDLRERLEQARRQLAAARALRAATPAPMALEMRTIAPWHELVVEVWSLSAALRAAGIRTRHSP